MRIALPATRTSFVYGTVGRYRYTIAYRVAAVEASTDAHDPCFILHVGMAFCNTRADHFVRKTGREEAAKRMNDEPLEIRLYPGGILVQAVVERAWAGIGRETLERHHMPGRATRWLGGVHRSNQPSTRRSEAGGARRNRANASRLAYNEAIRAGKTRAEAIAAARATAT